MSSFSRIVLCLIALSGGALAAEPSAEDVEKAKDAFADAMDYRDKGDLERALAYFRSAFTLVPTPITALEVGRTELALGHTKAARDTLRAAAAMPPKAGESAKAKQARAEAKQLAEELDGKLAHLTISTGATPPSEMILDGKTLAPEDATSRLEVDPGHHVIIVRSPGKSGREEVDLQEGEDRTVTVTLRDDAPLVRQASHRHRRLSKLFWAGTITAGAGLVTGTITGIAAIGTADGLKSQCPNKICPPSARGQADASRTLGWISTFGFITLGVGAALAAVGLATSPMVEEAPKTGMHLVVGPGIIGLEGRFR